MDEHKQLEEERTRLVAELEAAFSSELAQQIEEIIDHHPMTPMQDKSAKPASANGAEVAARGSLFRDRMPLSPSETNRKSDPDVTFDSVIPIPEVDAQVKGGGS